MHACRWGGVVAAIGMLAGACAGGRGPAPAPAPDGAPPESPCLVRDEARGARDTVFLVDARRPARPSSGSFVDCEGRRRGPAPEPPVIVLDAPAGADLRDVLDRGVADGGGDPRRPDVLVTRDPNVIAYAARSGGYVVAPLPWSETWALVTIDADSAPPVPTAGERDALASDAIRADARGAAPPFAWLADTTCGAAATPRATPAARFVAYARGDAIGRQLAERIVSLAASAGPGWIPASLRDGTTPRVVASAPDSIAGALTDGRVAAAVVMLQRAADAPCGIRGGLAFRHAVPLVDARAHAIVRRGSGAAFVIAADGSLHFLARNAP